MIRMNSLWVDFVEQFVQLFNYSLHYKITKVYNLDNKYCKIYNLDNSILSIYSNLYLVMSYWCNYILVVNTWLIGILEEATYYRNTATLQARSDVMVTYGIMNMSISTPGGQLQPLA